MKPLALTITGTDTDAGKSLVSAALLRAAQRLGWRVLGIKPVQTGVPAVLKKSAPNPNSDEYLWRRAAVRAQTSTLHVFELPCSPHLAAEFAGENLEVAALAEEITACAAQHEFTLIEGAGGLLVPLNRRETMADLFAAINFPTLLVVANRLGCVNHALLTLEALRLRGISCPGFVLTETAPPPDQADHSPQAQAERLLRKDSATVISELSGLPCLASIPFLPAMRPEAPVDDTEKAWTLCAELMRPILLAFRNTATNSASGQKTTPQAHHFQADELLDFDCRHIWHPYTSAVNPLPVYEAAGTTAGFICLRDGRMLLDGMASWWCAIHGYNHPRLTAALQRQAARMPHVMFGGLTHQGAASLAERLLDMTGPDHENMDRVFFADSGSVAVEAACKMALQYQHAAGSPAKNRLMTIRGGYHGDTMGAMSVCDPHNGMHSLFAGMLPQQIFAPRPACAFEAEYDPAPFEAFKEIFLRHKDETAALILEPIVQGAGGMWFYHPHFLRDAAALCREYGALVICDEIATGFGRTGELFASRHAGIAPDIICLGKALTGGVMTLAAVLASKRVAEGVSADGAVFMHGPTFMANPLACAAANASLDILAENRWQQHVRNIERTLAAGLLPCKKLPGVRDARVLGAIGVLEMDAPVNVPRLQRYFVERHKVWIRPFSRLIYIMPPYILSEQDVARLTTAMAAAVEDGAWR